MSSTRDFDSWPIELPELIGAPQFASRVTAAARKRLGNVTDEEVFDGISSFVIRALEEEAKNSESSVPSEASFLSRFPTLFSVIRYIVVTIRNRRIREDMHREETNADADIDSAVFDGANTSTFETAIISYLALITSSDPIEISEDPAGLDVLERQVVVARWEGHSQSEIGFRIRKSASTVHRIEKKALAKLRSWLLG